jgi:dTDP-L-rhamnose 4-epimerase
MSNGDNRSRLAPGDLILVTGGAGFIGSHTVDALLERGYRVRILDSLQPRVHPRGKPSWVPAEAHFIRGDVANYEEMSRALDGVHGVVHLAAYQDYLPDFSRFVHTNSESAALLFELIVADRTRFPVRKIVFASSQSVCGEGRYLCRNEAAGGGKLRFRSAVPGRESRTFEAISDRSIVRPGPRSLEQLRRGEWEVQCPSCGAAMEPLLIDEETAAPHTAYGISKYAIELLAERLGRRYGIATVCMRYTYVQGPRNSFFNAYSGIARRFAMRIMHGLPPIAYEDGGQLRDYVNVYDVARANLLVLESEAADFQVFNVGGGRAVTVLEFARLMLEAFGSTLEVEVPGEFRLGDTRHTISDISKLRALGWEPVTPVEENVGQYVEWIRGQSVAKEFLLEAEQIMQQSGVVQRAKSAAARG